MKESSFIAIFGEKVGKPQQLHERPQSRTLATPTKDKTWGQNTPRFLSVLNYRIQMRVGHGRFPTWADHSKVRLVTDGGLNGPEKPRQKPHGIDVFNSEDKISYMYLYVSIGIYVCASIFANVVKNKNCPVHPLVQ